MTADEPQIIGGCLCGSIRYLADGPPFRTVVCHCLNCQKQSGSAFSVVLAIAASSLHILGELVDYVDRAETGGTVLRRFCGRCGSPVISVVSAKPDLAFIKAGTLDDSRGIVPEQHIWCRSAQPWVEIDFRIPRHERAP